MQSTENTLDNLFLVKEPKRRGRPTRRELTEGSITEVLMADAAQTQPARSNGLSFDEMRKIASDLGAEAGRGNDVQIKFDLQVITCAFHGNCDLTKDKHGPEKDDAAVFAEEYFKARNGTVVFDAKAPNQRKLISNVRKCIKLAGWTKGGVNEPLQNVNELMTVWQQHRKKPNGRKLNDAHNTLMLYATKQLSRDTLISGSELEAFCFKANPDQLTNAEAIEAIRKKLSQLKQGKMSNVPVADTSPEIDTALNALNKRLKAIAQSSRGV